MKYESIKKACQITDEIFSKIIKRKFETEIELAEFIIKEIKSRGLKMAFKPIVAASNSEIHHEPTNSKLKGFVVIDFGVKYKEYCSDMTRTVFYGKASKEDKKLYELLKSVQENTIKKITIGMNGGDLDQYARDSLGKYSKYFKHSLGHGVGKKVHSGKVLYFKRKSKINKGCFITIEPGIYFNNKGLRIEDTIYVGNKIEILTKSTKKLVEIT